MIDSRFLVTPTLNSLVKLKDDVSWSQFSYYEDCQGRWFSTYFAKFKDLKKEKNQTVALPGIIIQAIFEVMLNERIYVDLGSIASEKSLGEWMRRQVRPLTFLLACEMPDQYLHNGWHWFKYFDTPEGVYRAQECLKMGLDPHFLKIGLRPSYIDVGMIETLWGSVDGFIKHLEGLCEPALENMTSCGMAFNNMVSEVKVETVIEGVTVHGRADFIWNPMQDPETFLEKNLNLLRDGFVVLDGKMNVGRYRKTTQLEFYAWAIHRSKGKAPGQVAFLDWNQSILYPSIPDLTIGERVHKTVMEIKEKTKEIRTLVRAGNMRMCSEMELRDLPLEYKSGYYCDYCDVSSVCSKARK